MAARQYIPNEYVDEVSPEGRAHPNDWLHKRADDSVILDLNGLCDPEDVTPELIAAANPLADGQIVEFSWFENFGRADLKFSKATGWLAAPPMPPSATHVCMTDDPTDFARSIADLVRVCDLDEGEAWEVEYYAWPDVQCVFRAETGAFEMLEAVGHG